MSAAIIIRTNPETRQKEVFAAQRGYGAFKDCWEFPGGKLEAGETVEQCAVREISEELGVSVKALARVGTVEYDYPDFHLTMHCVRCALETGALSLREHENGRWLSKETLYSPDWLPADKLILETVAALLAQDD